MKLRNKVFLVIALVWSLFAGITYLGSQYYLTRSFLAMESDRANRDLTRLDQAFEQDLNSLYTFTTDWAHWDDLYSFMQGNNPSFIATNLNLTAYVNASLNLITYWDANDNLITGAAIDLNKKKITNFPVAINSYLYPGSNLLDRTDVNHDLKGFILLPDGIMMVASVAITDGHKLKQPLGAMVTGRFISPDILKKISDITKFQLTLFTLPQIKTDSELLNAFNKFGKNNHYSSPIDSDTLYGYSLLRDINNQPIGMVQMVLPRTIVLAGVKAANYFLLSILALGVLFIIVMSALLRTLIIKRLEKLDSDVASIYKNNELQRRVDSNGNDELASVSRQINTMLRSIQLSQERLEFKVDERTRELARTNAHLQLEIVERKTAENELIKHKEYLAQLAHFDVLTNLPNRVLFNEMLDQHIKHSAKNQTQFAILFLGLDRFKMINDALGHDTGDLVLKEITARVSSVLHDNCILARFGGDEFIVVIKDNISKDNINHFANEVLRVCSEKITISSQDFYVSCSIGISLYPDDGKSLEQLQKNADLAMYKSKRGGGNHFEYFTADLNTEAYERIRLDSELRQALQQNEFVLYYQPKINIKTGKIIGVEALIRWNHPQFGLILPGRFIPLAEESGLIIQIGEWILKEACRINKAWQNMGHKPISIAVNISSKQVIHQDIEQTLARILAETELAPQYLELEITESAVMENMALAADKLNKVKALGVEVSIDDFGTGYTSLNYLKQFPATYLKIDQNFVKGIPGNQNDVSITTAMIALAHSLGMQVIAEGVETIEQFYWLAHHDCDIVQGYFLSRPLPESKIISEFMSDDAKQFSTAG